MANKCPKKIQKEVIKDARAIYNQEDRNKALQAYKNKKWQEKWRDSVSKAVECLEEDLEELLTFYELPKAYWKRLRTTNPIERVFAIFHRQNRIWEN